MGQEGTESGRAGWLIFEKKRATGNVIVPGIRSETRGDSNLGRAPTINLPTIRFFLFI